jgi:toxin ParE1/3/4
MTSKPSGRQNVQVKWTDLASRDLDAIESYIVKENGLNVATDVVLKIISVVEPVLTNHPHAGRLGRHKNTRELVIDGLPFIAIYSQESDQIFVLRILHTAQQWPTSS